MRAGKRFGLSAVQKSDVWRRWKAGQTLHEIGRAFGKEHSSIRCLVSRYGGIAPAVRAAAVARIWGLSPQGFLLGHQFRFGSLLLFDSA
jgi:hypothetical protein